LTEGVDGKPDHRIADGAKMPQAVKLGLCWLCGRSRCANIARRRAVIASQLGRTDAECTAASILEDIEGSLAPQCPFPILGDDGTQVACKAAGHCGCGA
jgi:hypothetical protein